ncbi:MAG: DUF3526 domain-containing protein [Lewinellaceae bacterium]|nr:DUF3526 domain-containing protein [Lewinellaceae bacterium]
MALLGSLGYGYWSVSVVPKAAVNLAKQLHPAPTRQAYNTAIKEDLEEGVDGHDPADAFTEKLEKETLAKYGVDSVQNRLSTGTDSSCKREKNTRRCFPKHKSELLKVYQQQRQVHQAAAVVSPFVLTGILSQRLAGTDVDVYFDFLAAAERYRVQLVGELNADLTNNFKYGDWDGKRGKAFLPTTPASSTSRPRSAVCSAIWAKLCRGNACLVDC